MRTACLVLAYNAAPVLRSAMGIYLKLGWDVFVHLDRKADELAYRRLLGVPGEACRFIQDPVEVFWGGYSMMKAEFKLIEAALAETSHDRFVLLTDDCFPLRSPGVMQQLLAEDVDRITCGKQSTESVFYKRYQGFFHYDHRATNPRGEGGREIDQALSNKINEALNLQLLGKKALDVYFGSQFWILRRDTVERIIEICGTDRHLTKSFEFSALPDELMIQSIYGNYLRDRPRVDGPVFADFSRGHGPLLYSSFDDFPADLPRHAAFIRKIDPDADQFIRNLEARVTADGWAVSSREDTTCSVTFATSTDVVPGRIDLALNKPATQSSISLWSHGKTMEEDARGANADVIHPDSGFHTNHETSPWWQVDLEDAFVINEIQIMNRRQVPDRLRQFSVLGSVDGKSWDLLYQKSDDLVFGENSDEFLLLRFSSGHAARYLRVRLDATGFLHFRSFKAFGEPMQSLSEQLPAT